MYVTQRFCKTEQTWNRSAEALIRMFKIPALDPGIKQH